MRLNRSEIAFLSLLTSSFPTYIGTFGTPAPYSTSAVGPFSLSLGPFAFLTWTCKFSFSWDASNSHTQIFSLLLPEWIFSNTVNVISILSERTLLGSWGRDFESFLYKTGVSFLASVRSKCSFSLFLSSYRLGVLWPLWTIHHFTHHVVGCYGKIFLYTVKKYNSDWLNKKLNGKELGRIAGGQKECREGEGRATRRHRGSMTWK